MEIILNGIFGVAWGVMLGLLVGKPSRIKFNLKTALYIFFMIIFCAIWWFTGPFHQNYV